MAPTAFALALILLMVFINGFPTGFPSALQTQTPPGVQLNPASLNFGKQVVRKPSVAKKITVLTSGARPCTLTAQQSQGIIGRISLY